MPDQYHAALRRLAGGVAHLLNNQLSIALGHAELALEGVPGESALAEDLSEIRAAALRSAALVDELLAFAEIQTLRLADLNLNAVVEQSVTRLRRDLPVRVRLEWLPAEPLRLVRADAVQVQQVVARLIMHASDALDGRGTIVLETRDLSGVPTAASPGAVDGEWVQLTVRDTGKGLDGESLERVFEPFFGAELFGPRRGLGLAADRGIVRQHGGWMGLESAPGRGTAVMVYLPALVSVSASPL